MTPTLRLLTVAGWIGVGAGAVTVAAGAPLLLSVLGSEDETAALGVLVAVVVAALGLAGIGLAATVLVLLRRDRVPAAAVATCVLGLALFPIWSSGLAWWVPPLPSSVGLLQLPVPLVVLGLGVVALVRLRRASASERPPG